MNSPLKSALEKLDAEEKRLQAELDRLQSDLAKVQAVKAALNKVEAGTAPVTRKAPHGMLDEKILSVLNRKTPRGNKEIREAIKAAGYAFSLTPLHVTKHLITLSEQKKVRRIGEGTTCKYVLR